MFVIAIVTGITIPYLRDITSTELTATARRLSSTTQYLFEEAAFRSRTYALNLDLEKNAWWVTHFDPATGRFEIDDSLPARRFELPRGVRIVDVVLPGLGKLSSGVAPTYFYPEGFADPAVVHLASSRNHAYTLRIDPIRGRGIIFDGYVDLEPSS
jgi:hypothetical protein